MNIIHIHSHDTGKLVSPYGYNLPTPNLEEISSEMLVFNNYHTVSPTCTPSRSATLTGTYPSTNGLIGLSQRGFSLQNKEWHSANIFKSNNFHTVLCGIQHEIGKYDVINKEELKTLGYEEIITNEFDGDFEKWDYLNLKHTNDFLENYSSDKPFYLSHGLFTTHRPYYDSKNISKNSYYRHSKITDQDIKDDDEKYHYSVNVLDDIIGQIYNKLKETKLLDETLVIISTDHGIANPFEKCSLTDEGTNIMCMIRHPHFSNTHNKTYDNLVANVDLLPTLLDLCNLEVPKHIEGLSFKAIFNDLNVKIRNEIFFELNFHTSYEPAISIRTDRYRLTKFIDKEYHLINYSNIDASPQKEYLHNNIGNYKKNDVILTDYLVSNNEALVDIDHEDIINELTVKLDEFDNNRIKFYSYGNEFDSSWKVNDSSDYEPSFKSK